MPNTQKTASELLNRDPQIMSGVPVFMRTGVPVKTLFDSIESGESLDFFLENFPSASRAQAVAVLDPPNKLPMLRALILTLSKNLTAAQPGRMAYVTMPG